MLLPSIWPSCSPSLVSWCDRKPDELTCEKYKPFATICPPLYYKGICATPSGRRPRRGALPYLPISGAGKGLNLPATGKPPAYARFKLVSNWAGTQRHHSALATQSTNHGLRSRREHRKLRANRRKVAYQRHLLHRSEAGRGHLAVKPGEVACESQDSLFELIRASEQEAA